MNINQYNHLYNQYQKRFNCSDKLNRLLINLRCQEMSIEDRYEFNPYYSYHQPFMQTTTQRHAPIITTKIDYYALEELAVLVEDYNQICSKKHKEAITIEENPALKEAYDNYMTMLALYSK
jgi:hypothetical protein